jgi:hypothetical protein
LLHSFWKWPIFVPLFLRNFGLIVLKNIDIWSSLFICPSILMKLTNSLNEIIHNTCLWSCHVIFNFFIYYWNRNLLFLKLKLNLRVCFFFFIVFFLNIIMYQVSYHLKNVSNRQNWRLNENWLYIWIFQNRPGRPKLRNNKIRRLKLCIL